MSRVTLDTTVIETYVPKILRAGLDISSIICRRAAVLAFNPAQTVNTAYFFAFFFNGLQYPITG